VVNGEVPLNLAQKLYQNPIGRKDVRVSGHCGCPPPEEWCEPSMTVQEHIKTNLGYKEEMTWKEKLIFWQKHEAEFKEECKKYKQYIYCYHIDSQEGLNLFVQTLIENY
jgi:hypothetical protein